MVGDEIKSVALKESLNVKELPLESDELRSKISFAVTREERIREAGKPLYLKRYE